MDLRDRITIEPDKRGGKPCIRGLRITVYDVLDYMASGMTDAEILADFPDLEPEDLRACLAFAAERERRFVSVPGAQALTRLLFDQNLSPRLVARLADLFPESRHVRDVGLASAVDSVVWAFAASEGVVVVSKDSDFHQRSFTLGPPPKVVWIRLGNCSTRDIAELLRRHAAEIDAFVAGDGAFLALG